MRWVSSWWLLFGFFLSSCAGGGVSLLQKSEEEPKPAKVIDTGYTQIVHDFEAGKVMEAFALAQAVATSDEDYEKVQIFLKKRLNPARIRLLRHYKRAAKKAERHHEWDKALSFYQQTAEFSAKPEVFLPNIHKMEKKTAQLRFDVLLKQRRLEDVAWLRGKDAYRSPKGVAKDDKVFAELLKKHHKMLLQRAQDAYDDANKYFKKGDIDAAYVFIESHLRLLQESSDGDALLKDIQKSWPKWLVIPADDVKKVRTVKKVTSSKKKESRVKKALKVPSQKEILLLLQQKRWLDAQDAAVLYQQHHGEGAEQLLQDVEAQRKQAAVNNFHQGNISFSHEHIDQAVKFWDRAVDLDPENSEYVDALRRAMVLQERLHLLRNEK